MSHPNRKYRLEALNPCERHYDCCSGDAAQDGYTRLARRPVGPYWDDMVSEEVAERLEQPFEAFYSKEK